MRIAKAPSLAAGALLFWALLGAPLTVHAEAALREWIGATPPLNLKDMNERAVDLESMRGRVVLINFWATWCEPCREEMPALERLRDKLKGRGFELVTVNYGESSGAVSRFLDRLKVSLPVLLDTHKETAISWRVKGLPTTFLVDAQGKARYWSFGEQDWTQGEPFRLVEALLAEAQGAQR
jgi:thiol-disulfide isomerase/thioredoxin